MASPLGVALIIASPPDNSTLLATAVKVPASGFVIVIGAPATSNEAHNSPPPCISKPLTSKPVVTPGTTTLKSKSLGYTKLWIVYKPPPVTVKSGVPLTCSIIKPSPLVSTYNVL